MTKKQNALYWGIAVIAVILVVVIISFLIPKESKTIKIGVVTDLTGPVAYWGESARVGAELAAQDLNKKGYKVSLIFEDYKLDAAEALNSAQKLVNIDQVNAVYAEFNPAAISIGSFVNGKNVLFVYDAAVTSPLKGNPYAYKTYLDYQEGCKQVAEKFKDTGIEKIGVLKLSLEAGELCLLGVKEVYGNNTFVESYNLGDQDFRTQLLKLKQNEVGAVINVGFEGDTLNALKVIKEQGLNIKYGTVDDTITQQVIALYSNELAGSWSFGFPDVNADFSQRISGNNLATEYGAAIAYTHIMQMGKALSDCDNNLICATEKMDNSEQSSVIGFKKFNNQIAELEMKIIAR